MLNLTTSLIEWIKDYFKGNDNAKAIIGISGGKDSSVVAKLLVEALGVERVIFVLMPNNTQDDIEDSYKLLDILGAPFENRKVINIAPIYDNTLKALGYKWGDEVPGAIQTNLPSRIRMSVLYAISATYPGSRVVNTCNKSEDYVGYSTKFGDAAGDFSPLADLTVREVLMVGDDLGLPKFLVHKTPSDGMSGSSDEQKLGFLYSELDDYILETGEVRHETKERIEYFHRTNLHKLEPMPKFVKSAKLAKEVLDLMKEEKEAKEKEAKELAKKKELERKQAEIDEKLRLEEEKKAKELAEKQAKKEAEAAKKALEDAEKQAKKEALEAEKQAKKEAEAAKKALEEAEKQAKKEALEVEKQAKKEAEAAKKALEEAERQAKKEAEEAKKAALKEEVKETKEEVKEVKVDAKKIIKKTAKNSKGKKKGKRK